MELAGSMYGSRRCLATDVGLLVGAVSYDGESAPPEALEWHPSSLMRRSTPAGGNYYLSRHARAAVAPRCCPRTCR
jgi:hypothetical protein